MTDQSSADFGKAVEDDSGTGLYEALSHVYVERLNLETGGVRYSLTTYEHGALDGITATIPDDFMLDVLSKPGTPIDHVGERRPTVRVFDLADRGFIEECMGPRFEKIGDVLDALDRRLLSNSNTREHISPFSQPEADENADLHGQETDDMSYTA